ncbi:hypothetical protein ACXYX3_27630 (plasmid) [Mycobacterium sp. C3-094]
MTSADLGSPASALDIGRIATVAERIAADWGNHGHATVSAMIAELYIDVAVLPPHYTPDQRVNILTDAADTTTSELTTMLDDHIHEEADRPPVTEHGWTMHTEDRHHALTAALSNLVSSHLTWWLDSQLYGSMTGHEEDCRG